MLLDLTSFKKAVESLDSAILIANNLIQGKDKKLDSLISAGVIQNFEFTYELSWKFMLRWLENNYSPSISSASRKELFRTALEYELIENFDNWLKYNEARNKTSHTYDHKIADFVFQTAIIFLNDAKILLSALENKNDE